MINDYLNLILTDFQFQYDFEYLKDRFEINLL